MDVMQSPEKETARHRGGEGMPAWQRERGLSLQCRWGPSMGESLTQKSWLIGAIAGPISRLYTFPRH